MKLEDALAEPAVRRALEVAAERVAIVSLREAVDAIYAFGMIDHASSYILESILCQGLEDRAAKLGIALLATGLRTDLISDIAKKVPADTFREVLLELRPMQSTSMARLEFHLRDLDREDARLVVQESPGFVPIEQININFESDIAEREVRFIGIMLNTGMPVNHVADHVLSFLPLSGTLPIFDAWLDQNSNDLDQALLHSAQQSIHDFDGDDRFSGSLLQLERTLLYRMSMRQALVLGHTMQAP